MLILIDPQRQWRAGSAGKLGRPVVLPDTAIRLCLPVKVPVKLPFPTATRLPSSRSARMGGKNWRLWREDCPATAARNTILRDIRQDGRAG
jgi:hypothetical protein